MLFRSVGAASRALHLAARLGSGPLGRVAAPLSAGQRRNFVQQDEDIYYFNRDVEKASFDKLLGSKAEFTGVVGPRNAGKSRFIAGIAEQRKPKQAFVTINLRGKDVTTTAALTKLILKSVTGSLPKDRCNAFIAKFAIGPQGVEVGRELKEVTLTPTERLEQVLEIVENVMDKKNYITFFHGAEFNPVLVIDEAQLLYRNLLSSKDPTAKEAYDILMTWVIRVTKEQRKFHIIFASSAPNFFMEYSQEVRSQMSPMFLGDLSEEKARVFWQRLGGAEDKFEEVYDEVGGHMFHLEQLCAGDYEVELEKIKARANLAVSQFVESSGVDAVIAIERIVENKGYVTRAELKEALKQHHGSKAAVQAGDMVNKMVFEHGLLQRVTKSFSMDLPEEAVKLPIITAQCRAEYKQMVNNLATFQKEVGR